MWISPPAHRSHRLHLYFRLECLHGGLQWHLPFSRKHGRWTSTLATKVSRIPPQKKLKPFNTSQKKNISRCFWVEAKNIHSRETLIFWVHLSSVKTPSCGVGKADEFQDVSRCSKDKKKPSMVFGQNLKSQLIDIFFPGHFTGYSLMLNI